MLWIEKRSAFFRVLISATLFVFVWGILTPYAALASEKVTVPAGTIVNLRLDNSISPETMNIGDQILLSVANDVIVDGKVVIAAGATARGEITDAKKRGIVGMPGKISMSVRSVDAVDGSAIGLHGARLAEGKSKLAVSLVLTLLCCILFILMKGEDATIPAGSEIQAEVSGTNTVMVQ